MTENKTMLRKLRNLCCGNKPASSHSPPTTTIETDDASPRAIHISDAKQSPTNLHGPGSQSISIIVVNAKGAANYSRLCGLLETEKELGFSSEWDPVGQYNTLYLCDGYAYDVDFVEPIGPHGIACLSIMQHVCLVFTYGASSRDSWDEVVAVYEAMRSRCDHRVFPLPTMIAAMVEGPVSHQEAETFASQRACLFAKFSPTTGRGVCDAVGSLVELAHGARDQYPTDRGGFRSEDPRSVAYRERIHKRAQAIQALFAE